MVRVHVHRPLAVPLNETPEEFHMVSSPGEFHPQALSEPDLRLSPHPAPIIQP